MITTNIKIPEGYIFTSKNLEDYKKINETKERFPLIYKFEEKGKVEQTIIDIDKIDIPKYMDQKVRDGNNPAKSDIEKDINARGFSLDGLSIVLSPNKEGKYDVIDGVTKLTILKAKKVKNVPVTIIPNILESERYKLGIKLNHKDKPYGQASLGDIKKVVKQLIKLGNVKANGKSLEQSINDTIIEMAGDKIPEGKINNLVNEIHQEVTDKDHLLSFTSKTAEDRLRELGCKNDKHTVYIPVASFIEKTLMRAVKEYKKHKEDNPNIEIRLCVYVGDVNPLDPIQDWNNRCLNFKKDFDTYLKNISNYLFDGTKPNFSKIKMYGAIPQVYSHPKVSIDELYVFSQ